MLDLAALVCLALAAGGEAPPRLIIPDEIFLRSSYPEKPAPEACPDEFSDPLERAEREAARVKVAFADPVDLTGHLEGHDGTRLNLLGRTIESEDAEFEGGGRGSLARGLLVRVQGTGAPGGIVRAHKVEILPGIDPARAAKLQREVDKFKAKFWKKARRLHDPALVAYLQRIVNRLLPTYIPGSERRFEVSVVLDPDLNAFALPDGTVVVNTGLIARMDNEAQLASVLGHEMAHITQQHAERSMRKDTEHSLLNWGSLLAAVALGMSGKGDAAQGVQLMSSALLAGYSRAHEDEADRVGLRYLYLAGYDVRQAPEVWSTFRLLYGDPSSEANFFYGSHSTPREREHNLGHEIWKSYEPSGLLGGRQEREEYQRATAGALRENALADLKQGNYLWAEWAVHKALAVAPEEPLNHVAAGRLALRRGEGGALEQALESFRHALALDPSCAPAHFELGMALLRQGEREQAQAALRRYLELEPSGEQAAQARRALERG